MRSPRDAGFTQPTYAIEHKVIGIHRASIQRSQYGFKEDVRCYTLNNYISNSRERYKGKTIIIYHINHNLLSNCEIG